VKGKDLPSIQKWKGRSPEFCGRPIEEGVYQTIKILSDVEEGKRDY